MKAKMDDEDLSALVEVLQIARPSEVLHYRKGSTRQEDMVTWNRAYKALELLRLLLPKGSSGYLDIQEAKP